MKGGAGLHHVHPLTIVQNLGRVLYFVIIPVLRGFVGALRGDLARWAQGAWVDILVLLLMVTVAVWRWWVATYTTDGQEFVLRTGWLVTRQIRVPMDNMTTISVVESFYLRPFGAALLRADTLGGSAGRPDFSILVKREQAERLLERQRLPGGQIRPRRYVPKLHSILALALLTSNSFGGILFISTFVSQSGRLLGRGFSDLLVGTFEELARTLAFGVPPAAAAIAYILLAGWLIGFLLTFFRYKNFEVSRGKDTLNIGGGVFTNRQYCIRFHDINFIDMRQSIATKAMGMFSLYISAVGYGKHKDDISCIIPTEDRTAFTLARERLFPAFSPSRLQVRPKLSGVFRFIGAPLTLCAAIPLAIVLLTCFFPAWRDFVLFVGLMSLAPALFFLTIRAIDFKTGGFSKSGKFYTLRYSKGFYLHTVVIPEDKIVSITLRQSPVQQIGPNCDLFLNTRAETRLTHLCRNLNKAEIERILGL